MLLSDKEIIDLIKNIGTTIEFFDANAHEYDNFINRISEATTNHQHTCLKYVNNYGLLTEVALNGRFARILVEEELPFEEIFNIDKFKTLHPKIKEAIEANIVDCDLECDELQEHRALFNYELITPLNLKLILDGIEKAEEYVNHIKYKELHKLQKIIKQLILEHSWIERGE